MIKFFLTDLARKEPNAVIKPKAAASKNGTIEFFLTAGQEGIKTKSDFSDQGKCERKSAYSPSEASTIIGSAKRAGKTVNVEAVDFTIAWLRNLIKLLCRWISKDEPSWKFYRPCLEQGRMFFLCSMNTIVIEWHKGTGM